jgi:C4-dicarboxylate transporter DctM subunit
MISKAVLPMIIACLIVLLIVTYIPQVSLLFS